MTPQGILTLTDEQLAIASVCSAFGVWNDVLYVLRDAAYQLRAIGESRQAEAMRIDAESMERRAMLHLRTMTARERLRLVPADDVLPCVTTSSIPPANDNQSKDEGAACVKPVCAACGGGPLGTFGYCDACADMQDPRSCSR